jgi:hypothetical protein
MSHLSHIQEYLELIMCRVIETISAVMFSRLGELPQGVNNRFLFLYLSYPDWWHRVPHSHAY